MNSLQIKDSPEHTTMFREIAETLHSLNPTVRELRRFGVLLAMAAGAVAAVAGYPVAAATIATAIFLIALFTPRAIRPIHFFLAAITLPIGWLVARVILTILFFLVLTPTALLLCLLGRDPLKRKRQSNGTYWELFEKNKNPDSMGL